MEDKILKRSETEKKYTWDLTQIYKTKEDFNNDVKKLVDTMTNFIKEYKGKLSKAETIAKAYKDMEKIYELSSRTSSYASLTLNEDFTNNESQKQVMEFRNKISTLQSELSFFNSELIQQEEDVLKKAIELNADAKHSIEELLRDKPHTLSPESERVIAALSPAIEGNYDIYNTAKLVDMKFEPYEVNGTSHPLSFNLFEGELEHILDTKERRAAFKAFSQGLENYKNTIAKAYSNHIQNEKIISDLRGYESVIDYLLAPQNVKQDLYNRQIDVIMEELAPHMRKYVKLLKKIHKLDKLTYADLKLDVDADFEPEISIEDSKKYIYGALKVLGGDYEEMLQKAMDERWIDFVNNIGKSSGAFASSVAGVHPYILISWTSKMREVFVLAHELGHAGHFTLAGRNNSILNLWPSSYLIEAPSTMNEMLMANYLLKSNDDLRFRRWVLSSIISRTYYHNFVTHLLEAYYQREVYRKIDKGESVSEADLSNIFRSTLEKFWGEDVEITEGAELTWMRQPHYYMGLYPYTYSAGLTIATQVSQRILKGDETAVSDWRKVLSAGGTLNPIEFAKTAGVDITTDKALKDTIAYIGSVIDEIIKLTEEMEK